MKISWAGILLGAGLLLFSSLAFSSQPEIVPAPKNEEEIKKRMHITYNQHILPEGADPQVLEHLLEIGEVIIFYDNPPGIPWMSAAGILIDAPIEVVFQTVTDFDHYPEFMPMTDQAKTTKIFDNLYRVDYRLNVRLAIISYKINYGVYHYHRPPYRTDWCYAWGEFGKNLGFYELIPTKDGKRTMCFYSVYSEPRSRFLRAIYSRDPILERLTNVSTATLVMRAIKKEAEQRYCQQGGKILQKEKSASRPILEVLKEDPKSLGKILEQGKLLVLEEGPTVYVTAGAIVRGRISQAWKVITDFTSYPEFVSGVKNVEYLGRGEKGPRYRWDIDMDLGIFHYRYSYEAEYELNPPSYAKWMIPRENAGDIQGFWQLQEENNYTLIFNGSTADLRAMGWLLRALLRIEPTFEYALLGSQALVNISAVKDEIEKRAQAQ